MTETDTYTVELPESLYQCPKWWQNFINGKNKDFDAALADFGAVFIEEEFDDDNIESGYRTEQWVEFESHAAYTMFLLRWAK